MKPHIMLSNLYRHNKGRGRFGATASCVDQCKWRCAGRGTNNLVAYGATPREAYLNWLDNRALEYKP